MPVGDRAISKKELESLSRELRNQIKAVRGHAVSWAGTFLDLNDTPESFSSQASKVLAVTADEVALEFIDPTFLALVDVPSTYAASGLKILRVNSTPDAVEFGADLNDLEDVNAPAPNDGDALVWVDASSEWQPVAGGAAHNILSAAHLDAETAALVRGDLLIADSVPELVGLAISATVGQVLRTDGTDPAWATLGMNELANTSLADPNADRIVFWDDSPTGEFAFLTATEGIQIATQDLKLNVNALSEVAPASGDFFVFYDITDSIHKKVDFADMGGGGGAPVDASYLVLGYHAELDAERLFTIGQGLEMVDGGVGSTYTIHNKFHESSPTTETGHFETSGYVKAHELWIQGASGSNYLRLHTTQIPTANRELDIQLNDANRILDLAGSLHVDALNVYLDQNLRIQDAPTFDSLYLRDIGNDHTLRLLVNEDFTATRTLYLMMVDANRYLSMAGNLYVEAGTSRINQDLTDNSTLAEFDSLRLGGTPATAGDLRMTNAGYIYSRNFGGTVNQSVLGMNANDLLVIGNGIYVDPVNRNIGFQTQLWGTSAKNVLAFYSGIAPTTSPTNVAQMWAKDLYGGGSVGFQIKNENTGTLNVAGVEIKTDTGNPAAGYPGMLCNNTFDNVTKIFADAGWRTLTRWNLPRARAYRSGDQNDIVDNTWTQVQYNVETYDVGSDFNVGTFAFVAPITAYYDIDAQVTMHETLAGYPYYVSIYVNGSAVQTSLVYASTTNDWVCLPISGRFYVTAAQEIEIWVFHNDGTSNPDITGSSAYTYMHVQLSYNQ